MERPQSRGGSLQRFSSKGPHRVKVRVRVRVRVKVRVRVRVRVSCGRDRCLGVHGRA